MIKSPALIIIVLSLSLVIVAITVGMRSQVVLYEYVNNVEAMWNDEELFIVFEKGAAVQKTNLLLRKLSELGGIVFPQSRRLPEDLIIFHKKEEVVKRQEHRRIGAVGHIMPFDGKIYFMRGSDPEEYPFIHQLIGEELVRVPRENGLQIVESIELVSELIQREGWQKKELNFRGEKVEYPIQQGQNLLKVIMAVLPENDLVKIELVDETEKVTRTLHEFPVRTRVLNREEARELDLED